MPNPEDHFMNINDFCAKHWELPVLLTLFRLTFQEGGGRNEADGPVALPNSFDILLREELLYPLLHGFAQGMGIPIERLDRDEVIDRVIYFFINSFMMGYAYRGYEAGVQNELLGEEKEEETHED